MSECKHEWYLKSGRGYLYCPLCGKTVPVENYVESLETKLAAAEEAWDFKTALITDLRNQISKLLKTNSDNVTVINNLQDQLTTLKTKIRKAYMNTEELPNFLKKPREKSIEDIIEILVIS